MGFLAAIGTWVATNLPTIVKVTKKIAAFVHNSAEVVDAFLDGRAFVDIKIEDRKSAQPRTLQVNVPRPAQAPIRRIELDAVEVKQRENHSLLTAQIDDRKRELDQHKREFEQYKSDLELYRKNMDQDVLQDAIEHKKMKLQIDILELIIAAQHLERFSNNIRIHSANLETHYQTIRNMTGILDDVNHHRVAIKALIRTVNHIINVGKFSGTVDKIAGIDIDMKEGAISIHDSYKAFENTRTLIVEEISGYLAYLSSQRTAIARVRVSAKDLPNVNTRVSQWLDDTVLPAISKAENGAKALGTDLEIFQKIEMQRNY